MSTPVDPIVMLGMLVVVPAGLRPAGDPALARIQRLRPLFAVPGAVSLRLPWMAATHGLGNALGFALCSLLAWRRLQNTTHPESRNS